MKNPFRFINDIVENHVYKEQNNAYDKLGLTLSKEATERLSTLLSLNPKEKSWSFGNSDEDRLEEFMAFYESHVPVERMEREELANLILLSADDEYPPNKDRMVLVALFVKAHHREFPITLACWASPGSSCNGVPTAVEDALLEHYGQKPEVQLKNPFGSINDLTEVDSDVAEEALPTICKEATERLSIQLSLIRVSQTWRIYNADASRFEEFMAFYESHVPVEPIELEELAGLILQSAEHCFYIDELHYGKGSLNRNRMVLVALFVQAHHLEFPGIVEFYAGSEACECTVATVVKRALLEHYGHRSTE